MKKVLIALDYSPSSQKVAETGHAIAKSMGAEVVLLHVLADYSYYMGLNYTPILGFSNFNYDFTETMNREQLATTAAEFLNQIKGYLEDPAIQVIVKEGEAQSEILDTAAENGCDLITVGTHSRSGFDRLLMGSVAEKVVQKSDIPVLIVPINELGTE